MTDSDFEKILARLQHLEDLEAVRHTWRDYCVRLDSEDWAGLGDVYCEDGVLEMVGLDALLPGIDGVSFQSGGQPSFVMRTEKTRKTIATVAAVTSN